MHCTDSTVGSFGDFPCVLSQGGQGIFLAGADTTISGGVVSGVAGAGKHALSCKFTLHISCMTCLTGREGCAYL
jgi:hypothetical protein